MKLNHFHIRMLLPKQLKLTTSLEIFRINIDFMNRIV